MLELTKRNSTTMVVVLMPPAVDPGLPPMNIRIMVKNLLPSDRAPVSMELKPAVLAVTELNKEDKIFPLTYMSAMRRSFSRR